jgi:aryl-alcohol dehydrogenase-like predicted oxidoreductase
MQYRKLGNSGIDVSVVGLGTWFVGGWKWDSAYKQQTVDAIQTSIDSGINFIDTAPAYGLGASEEYIAAAIKGRRDKVVIATKCGLVWDTDKGTFFFGVEGKIVHRYLGPESIKCELECSLKRLNIDYIDLYQTHWQDDTTPIEDTMSVLMDLKSQGKIRAIGVSNADSRQMDEYRRFGQLDADQEKYSMLDRQMENGQLEYCSANNISVLTYSPLALGLLSGKIDPNHKYAPDDERINNPRFQPDYVRNINAMLDEFAPIARAHNATIAQIIIAWTFMQPGITSVLCGARDKNHTRDNAIAGDIVLTESELAQMNKTVSKRTMEC